MLNTNEIHTFPSFFHSLMEFLSSMPCCVDQNLINLLKFTQWRKKKEEGRWNNFVRWKREEL